MISKINIKNLKPFNSENYPKTYKWITELIDSKFNKLPDWVDREKFYQAQRNYIFNGVIRTLDDNLFHIDNLFLLIPLCSNEINPGEMIDRLDMNDGVLTPKRVVLEILTSADVSPLQISKRIERWHGLEDAHSEYEDEEDKTKPIPLKKRLMYIKKLLEKYPRVLCYHQDDYFGEDAPEPKCPEIVKIPVKSILQEDDDAYDDPEFYEDDDKHNLLEFWKMEQIEENKFDCEVYLHCSECECDFIYPDIYLTDEGKWVMEIQGEVLFELI